ncbi:MAG: DUF1501 domain-containing protein [Planctomycetaceae bacterium]|nr:DUF1501 domain-containing protein [Planctomycetaceae bacterium]MBT6486917.1 DUF1501 domain-containing protein [Planctomycetaceae bacterium]MBT6493601.1 DUF1501 domain-containing protein [Planctomycetaceae bacterium]
MQRDSSTTGQTCRDNRAPIAGRRAAIDRRQLLRLGLSGVAGLTLPELLRWRAQASEQGNKQSNHKSVILLWMAGGPSQIDTWDPKPRRPSENRGPFATTSTALPGTAICEHLPKQAAMLDRFTLIRSVDSAGSDHSPGKVMQTGNRKARPRSNPLGDTYPAIGSVVAKFRGEQRPEIPPYVAFNRDPAHVAGGGAIGMRYNAMNGHRAAGLPEYEGFGRLTKEAAAISGAGRFTLPDGLSIDRLHDRNALARSFDRLRSETDRSGTMDAFDHFQRQAVELVLGGKARQAFDLSLEPEASRVRYGEHLWCQQALLARRLVEAGVSFVTIDLSFGINAGDWDSHGDNHVFGGIGTGLKPLLPVFDHLVTTLVTDLEQRAMLDDVLILAMGEFGRSPIIGTQTGFVGGRNHWPRVMSMCMAGGGLKHGQVIGSTDPAGGHINTRPVTPADIAATVYKHMGVPLDITYEDRAGRPINIVDGNGQPIRELF